MRLAHWAQVAVLSLVAPCVTISAQTFKAGAGRSEVQIPASLYPVDGFTAQHDPMMTRVLLLDDGDERLGILVVDQTSINNTSIAGMKAILQKIAGVQPENAIVCASHTFSAPHAMTGPPPGQPAGAVAQERPEAGKGAALEQAIEDAVQSAATEAISKLQPARVGFGNGTSMVNVNRDVPTPKGWWLGSNDTGYADHSLAVVRFDALDGKPLALLVNLAVQSSIMDHSVSDKGGKQITTDLAGAAMHNLEDHYGPDTVALFLIGAAGDQEPYLKANRHVVSQDGSAAQVDIHDAGFTLVDLLGERLGQDALAVSDGIKATSTKPELEVERKSLEVPALSGRGGMPSGPVTTYQYEQGTKTDLPVVLVRIGDIAIVGLQAELAASVGNQIKIASAFPHTIVATMVDGGAKYMPDAGSYDRFTYEARNTRYAQGSAEAAASQIEKHLKQLHDSPASMAKQNRNAPAQTAPCRVAPQGNEPGSC